MPSPFSELRLFGLDLSAAPQEVRHAWRKVLHRPAFAWLGPSALVLLHDAQGTQSVWKQRGERAFIRIEDDSARGRAQAFQAIELPEEVVLRKQLTLPPLREPELARAVELEAQSHSPFTPSDLVWGHLVTDTHQSGAVKVELVLASRRKIGQYLGKHANLQQPEVWARCAGMPDRAFGLHGYGEERRLRAARRGWGTLGFLAFLALALLIAIAVTPTLQLRQRALQALEASDHLVRQTRPQVAKREALLAAAEQVHTLQSVVGSRLDPLRTMQTLTSVLGDETVLQRLQIEGEKVLIAGHTPDTAAMMQKLSAQPGFKGVRAPSAATRPAGATKETFQVEFTIDESSSLAGVPSAQATQQGVSP